MSQLFGDESKTECVCGSRRGDASSLAGGNDPRSGDSRVRIQAGVGDGERQRPRDTEMGKEIGTRDRNKTTEGCR